MGGPGSGRKRGSKNKTPSKAAQAAAGMGVPTDSTPKVSDARSVPPPKLSSFAAPAPAARQVRTQVLAGRAQVPVLAGRRWRSRLRGRPPSLGLDWRRVVSHVRPVRGARARARTVRTHYGLPCRVAAGEMNSAIAIGIAIVLE